MSFLMNLILFAIVISVVVFIHELGHFSVAKMCGVKVNEFAVGMGPALFSKRVGDTKYAIRAIPLGGFVSMEGENEESDDEGSFMKQKPLSRLMILLAGIFNNFVLGWVLIFIYLLMTGVATNVIDIPMSGYPAESAGLLMGDEIIEIDGKPIQTWSDVLNLIASDEDGIVHMKVLREGSDKPVSAELHTRIDEASGRKIVGLRPLPVKDVSKVTGETFTVFFGIFTGIFELLRNIFRPGVASDLVGPIGLFQVVGDVGQRGISDLLFLTGYISVNIGIVNLLPIPAFDGGRAIMVLVEMLIGKRLNAKLESALITSGFVFILFLIVLTFYNDIMRLAR